MNCYLKKIQIKNFKSIDDISVNPHPELSVFIGKNGSGKSVFMSAILILRQIAFHSNFSRHHHHFDSHRKKQIDVESQTKIKVSFNANGIDFIYEALVHFDFEEKNFSRLVVLDEFWKIRTPDLSRRKISVPGILSIHQTRIEELRFHVYQAARFSNQRLNYEKYERDVKSVMQFRDEFQSISRFVCDMKYYSATKFADPSKCPSSFDFEHSGKSLRPGGHGQFLHDLYMLKIENKTLYNVYESIVCDKRLGLLDKIEFSSHKLPSYDVKVRSGGKVVKKRNSKTIVVPFFTKETYKLSPPQLSEGTFKTIALLFYIISDSSSTLLIEEPEVCVHHGLLDNILDIIKSYSHEKQVFLTTHSESVLDSVSPENLFTVLWHGHTEIVKFDKFIGTKGYQSLKNYLSDTGNLGEYIKHREILDD